MALLSFWWHMGFLSFASTMFGTNTVVSAYLNKVYHSPILIGIVTSILMGLPAITQLLFANFLRSKKFKKPYLIFGIITRASTLFMLSVVAFFIVSNSVWGIIAIVGLFVIFATTGSFAGIAYMDLLGKTIPNEKRYYFFPVRQVFAGLASLLAGILVKYTLDAFDFPHNYSMLFLFAAISLAMATGFFWFLKEPPGEIEPRISTIKTIKSIPSLLKDRKLFWYEIVQILSGINLMVLPFYTVYTMNKFGNIVGNLVIFQVLGMIFSNLLWAILAKHFGNVIIAKIAALLAASVAISISFLPSLAWYYVLFVVIGFVLGARGVFMDAYLIEIAPEKKRVMYVGIRGTIGFVGSLFSLFGGFFVGAFGFFPIFIFAFFGLSVAFSLTFKLG